MRENTRCEVDEPMSTPTLSTQIWSSSASVRPVEEKKMRSPSAPCSMTGIQLIPLGRHGRACCIARGHPRRVFGDIIDTSSLHGFGCKEAIHAVERGVDH